MQSPALHVLLLTAGSLLFMAPAPAFAEFSLNFAPQAGGHMTTLSVHGCSGFGGQTPFLMQSDSCNPATPEVVTDPGTGFSYWHMIVGSAAEGFIQESYVQTNTVPGTILSCAGNTCATNLNNMDPIGATGNYYTGNGDGNPRGTLIRQIVSDGEISMEFLKDQYDKKPLIIQMLNAPDISALFQADMRNSTYNDMNSPGTVINTLSLPGETVGAFDMANDVQFSTITAGRYTYTNGAGNGGSQGTYNYLDGNYDVKNVDWANYFDALDARNIWSYPTNKPK